MGWYYHDNNDDDDDDDDDDDTMQGRNEWMHDFWVCWYSLSHLIGSAFGTRLLHRERKTSDRTDVAKSGKDGTRKVRQLLKDSTNLLYPTPVVVCIAHFCCCYMLLLHRQPMYDEVRQGWIWDKSVMWGDARQGCGERGARWGARWVAKLKLLSS